MIYALNLCPNLPALANYWLLWFSIIIQIYSFHVNTVPFSETSGQNQRSKTSLCDITLEGHVMLQDLAFVMPWRWSTYVLGASLQITSGQLIVEKDNRWICAQLGCRIQTTVPNTNPKQLWHTQSYIVLRAGQVGIYPEQLKDFLSFLLQFAFFS